MSPRKAQAMAVPSSQALTPLQRNQSQSAKLTAQGVTIQGAQIFLTRKGMNTLVEESAPKSLQCQDAGVFGLDAVEAAGGERSGSVQSVSALHLQQHAPGQL